MKNKKAIKDRVAGLEKELLTVQKRKIIDIYPSDDEVAKAEKEYTEEVNQRSGWIIGASWMLNYIESRMK